MSRKELTLPPDIVAQFDERVANGDAANAVETRKLESARAKIAHSLADPRPVIPADVVFDRIDRLIDAISRPGTAESTLSDEQLADLKARTLNPDPIASDQEVERFFAQFDTSAKPKRRRE